MVSFKCTLIFLKKQLSPSTAQNRASFLVLKESFESGMNFEFNKFITIFVVGEKL